jgi:hypothetical protein
MTSYGFLSPQIDVISLELSESPEKDKDIFRKQFKHTMRVTLVITKTLSI